MAAYQPLKYSAHGVTMKSVKVSGGNDSTFAARECRTDSSQLRGRRGSVRRARVMGAPSAMASGTSIARIMCCAMWTLSRVSSYVPSPETVAIAAATIPARNAAVRPSGQGLPRRCIRSTPHR